MLDVNCIFYRMGLRHALLLFWGWKDILFFRKTWLYYYNSSEYNFIPMVLKKTRLALSVSQYFSYYSRIILRVKCYSKLCEKTILTDENFTIVNLNVNTYYFLLSLYIKIITLSSETWYLRSLYFRKECATCDLEHFLSSLIVNVFCQNGRHRKWTKAEGKTGRSGQRKGHKIAPLTQKKIRIQNRRSRNSNRTKTFCNLSRDP